jgi:hypothetical protein
LRCGPRLHGLLGRAPLRPLAGLGQRALPARGHHAWPRLERARWRAHPRLNAGEGVEQTEGKWSLDLGLPSATRKPRRGGREEGASIRGAFIGVPGAITDLIKSIIGQVLAGQPSHMAGRPWGAASTDSRPQVPFHHLLERVTTKETHGRLQSAAGRPPTGPTHLWPLHMASSCQVHSWGDTYFGRIPHFLVIT